MTTAFLYKWTEISTGMWYRGSRTKHGCHPDDGYICSSKIVKPKILANPSDWVREIECIGEPKYIRDLETKYLKILDAKNDTMSYNQHNQDGKFHTIGKDPWNKGKKCPRGPLSEEQKAAIKATKIKNGTTRIGVKIPKEQAARAGIASGKARIGKPRPTAVEVGRKLLLGNQHGKKNKGKKRPDNALRNKIIFKGKPSWNKGLKMPEDWINPRKGKPSGKKGNPSAP